MAGNKGNQKSRRKVQGRMRGKRDAVEWNIMYCTYVWRRMFNFCEAVGSRWFVKTFGLHVLSDSIRTLRCHCFFTKEIN